MKRWQKRGNKQASNNLLSKNMVKET